MLLVAAALIPSGFAYAQEQPAKSLKSPVPTKKGKG
jgi:hypothetical protein